MRKVYHKTSETLEIKKKRPFKIMSDEEFRDRYFTQPMSAEYTKQFNDAIKAEFDK